MVNFVGHWHPLLVHLPIGILAIGLFLYWYCRWKDIPQDQVLQLIFNIAAITSLLSCITGYVLSVSNDGYGPLVYTHRNAALALTTLTAIFCWMLAKSIQPLLQMAVSLILLVMLLITGHFGGTLTHGEHYLTGGSEQESGYTRPIENLPEALVYRDIIDPILRQKCVGCHGPQKQKGKLRLDTEVFILLGGKSGGTIHTDQAGQARLLKRILLPPDDEDHMPPKEKGQLTTAQKKLLEWWITTGASFKARVKELGATDSVAMALATLQQAGPAINGVADHPLPEVQEAPASAIAVLKAGGVIVVPIARNSHLLNVNFVNSTSITDSMLAAVEAIAPQLYWVKAEGPLVDDRLVARLKNARQLKRLSLAHSSITAQARPRLDSLKNLELLNVFGTTLQEKSKADSL